MSFKIEISADSISALSSKLLALGYATRNLETEELGPVVPEPAPKPAPEPEPAAPEPEPVAPELEPVAPEPEPVAPIISADGLKQLVLSAVAKNGREVVAELLNDFGVTRATEVSVDDLSRLVARLEALQ